LIKPLHGWGLLQIGDKTYAVHECHFDDADGRTCFCVRLRRHAGEIEYQLCQNRDNDLACDCPDATYRQRQCKHASAVTDAYAQLDRDRRLDDFLADAGDALDKLLPPLPEDPVPECLPVRDDADAEAVLNEAARTGDACGIIRRKGGAV
jgi:hypothetical protein